MTRVKICGITRREDLQAAASAGADAVGFVVSVPVDTPREIPASRARDLVGATPPFLTTVLVTMPETVDSTVELARRVGADAIQVHGDVSADDLDAIAGTVDGSLIVATEYKRAPRVGELADAVLIDSTGERGRGGTGETHDWERTREVVGALDTPVVLAGGLDPGNVGEAVSTVDPHAVDVASGVERDGGLKDHDAVERFVRTAHASGSPGARRGTDDRAHPAETGEPGKPGEPEEPREPGGPGETDA